MQRVQVFLASLALAIIFALTVDSVQAQSKIIEGHTYRVIDKPDKIVFISSNEIEMQEKGINLVGDYSIQNNRIMAVFNALGTKYATYFDIIEEGIRHQADGAMFYNSLAYGIRTYKNYKETEFSDLFGSMSKLAQEIKIYKIQTKGTIGFMRDYPGKPFLSSNNTAIALEIKELSNDQQSRVVECYKSPGCSVIIRGTIVNTSKGAAVNVEEIQFH